MAEKKYKVAEGVALTAKGVMFKAGDSIPAEVLTDDNTKALLAAKKIVEDKGDSAKSDGKKAAEEEAKKADDSKKTDDGKKAEGGK